MTNNYKVNKIMNMIYFDFRNRITVIHANNVIFYVVKSLIFYFLFFLIEFVFFYFFIFFNSNILLINLPLIKFFKIGKNFSMYFLKC